MAQIHHTNIVPVLDSGVKLSHVFNQPMPDIINGLVAGQVQEGDWHDGSGPGGMENNRGGEDETTLPFLSCDPSSFAPKNHHTCLILWLYHQACPEGLFPWGTTPLAGEWDEGNRGEEGSSFHHCSFWEARLDFPSITTREEWFFEG